MEQFDQLLEVLKLLKRALRCFFFYDSPSKLPANGGLVDDLIPIPLHRPR